MGQGVRTAGACGLHLQFRIETQKPGHLHFPSCSPTIQPRRTNLGDFFFVCAFSFVFIPVRFPVIPYAGVTIHLLIFIYFKHYLTLTMLSALFLAALPALAHALDDGIIRYPIRASPGAPIVKGVTRRQNEVALQSQNTGLFYSIDVTMGTPGQTITVNLDTGSQELWVNPVCDKSNDVSFCESFGHFGESSTFTSINVTGGLVYGTGYAYYNYGYDFITIGCEYATL